MNKIYRLMWCDTRRTWIVTAENSKSKGKRSSPRRRLQSAMSAVLMATSTLALGAPASDALPTGGNVTAGTATINQSGSTMNINQSTTKAIINWNTFNIGSGATVNFIQPGKSSITLNRVIGSDPSSIYGRLNAPGQVFLINPNGVLFGAGARVDVGGLVASTLNIRDEDFLAGNYRFNLGGANGAIVNQGELFGNYIALLAPEVRNEGVMISKMGTVALAAGEAVTLNITGDQLIDIQVDQASINTLIENKHLIQAEEGTVILAAQSANQLLGSIVNSGNIEAKGITTDGGKVKLLASSNIEHSGSINVDAGTNGNGGTAILLANLDNPDSRTDVSGSITARGGSESGDGGFIETSANHLKFGEGVDIDTSASQGATGQWLLDPLDFVVAASGGDITGATLGTLLDSNNVTIQTADPNPADNCDAGGTPCGNGSGGTNGDIIINDAVTWTSANLLTMDAWNDILINESLTFEGFGAGVEISYGLDGAGQAIIDTGVTWSAFNGIIFDKSNGFATTFPGQVDNTSAPYIIGTVAPVIPPPPPPPPPPPSVTPTPGTPIAQNNVFDPITKAVNEAQSQRKMSWQEAYKRTIDDAARKIANDKSTDDVYKDAYKNIYNDETYQTYLTVELLKKNGWTAKDFKDNGIDIAALKVPSEQPDPQYSYLDGSSSDKYKDTNSTKSYTAQISFRPAFSIEELTAAGYTLEDFKDSGFGAGDLIAAGYSAEDLKAAGFSEEVVKDKDRTGGGGSLSLGASKTTVTPGKKNDLNDIADALAGAGKNPPSNNQ
ncbi:MAG: filamentous hemagglutinin N-terminal domain-containing protein [Methylophilaceae bacterium]|nr:filamentous hemagglutinin N-terminal domain-containing protein [Methylophilaceae bacterium]